MNSDCAGVTHVRGATEVQFFVSIFLGGKRHSNETYFLLFSTALGKFEHDEPDGDVDRHGSSRIRTLATGEK